MQAIIHVDGDAFFASCEIAQNEWLRGKPVVTGEEKGIAIAVSYTAKARGVSRGMLMGDIKKIRPDVIILPGNYGLYEICARRMYSIVRRYAPVVEEYSIDECFADVSSLSTSWQDLVEIAHNVQNDLKNSLGMTFSLGLAPTKTLAKVASKWKKPAGFTAMQKSDIEAFLKDIPIGTVWGIGSSTSAELQSLGIKTALQFIQKDFSWIQEHFAKPCQEIWHELQGIQMHHVGEGRFEKHQSIRATRTFRPPSQDKNYILSELSKNAESACVKLRHHNLQAKTVYFFLKTQTFRYSGLELRFDAPITTPSEIMNAIHEKIDAVFREKTDYRATGIVLHSISPATVHQPDLFNFQKEINTKTSLYSYLDTLKSPVFLASSMKAREKRYQRKIYTSGIVDFLKLGLKLGIPYWGEAQ